MRLLRLRLTNFRQHQLTDLEFGTGITGIIGPNGAGKSTLLEAIAYALYGVPAARGTRETLRRRGAKPREKFQVELEFDFGGHQYRLTRTLTMAEFAKDGQVIANSTGAVTEQVTAVLGMTREAFFNTYFTGQKELAVMATMGRAERIQFLSRMFGYEKLRDAQDRLREQRSAMRAELHGIEQGLTDPAVLEAELDAAVAELERARRDRDDALATERVGSERVARLTPEWRAALDRRSAWEALDGSRRVAEGKVAASRASFAALDRELAAALRARDRLADIGGIASEWAALSGEREGLDRAAAAYAARSQSVARRDQLRQRLDDLRQQVGFLPDEARAKELKDLRMTALTAREQADRLVSERNTRWVQDKQEVRTRLEQSRASYKELKEQKALVEERGPEGLCPTCGRPLGKDFPALVALLGRQMEDLEIDGKYLRQRDEQLTEPPVDMKELQVERQRVDMELRSATEALGQLQAQLRQRLALEEERLRLAEQVVGLDRELDGPAADYDASRHQHVRSRLAELEPVRREFDQLSGLSLRAETLVGEAARAEEIASLAEAELVAIDARLLVLGWDPAVFALVERQMREAEAVVQGARIAVARSSASLDGAERLRQAALARQADRAAKAATARALGERITLLDELDRAFGELRTELNLQMRPELSEHASALLRDVTAGRYTDLELDEGYAATIVEDSEAKPVISGGEEDLVNLVMRLAISEMIAERAGQPLSLLVLDEIFGSLDEERRAAVLDLLRALADRFPQVILITHVEGMRDAFDRLIRMEYDVERAITKVWEETPEVADVAV